MRILFWTNAPFTHTGYGNQVKQILPRMQKLGHTVGVVANFGLAGNSINWRGIPIYPLKEQRQNKDVLGHYVRHFDADIVISLYDIWSLPANTKNLIGVPWIAMCPVDGVPVSKPMLDRLNQVDYVVSYSKFAYEELLKAGVSSTYIPHGIDDSIFTTTDTDKSLLRRAMGMPEDVFLITTVGANKGFPPRKSWPEMFAGYKKFLEQYPESLWYLHTTKRPLGSGGEGMYMDALEKGVLRSGLPPYKIAYPDDQGTAVGVPDEAMAKVYQASDVMLLASRGEGFGLPVLEAQACGCPVITTDCSAMSELTVNGVKIPPLQPQWIAQLGYYWQIPPILGIANALEEVFKWTEKTREENQAKGLEFAKQYAYDKVFDDYWIPFLDHVEETLW